MQQLRDALLATLNALVETRLQDATATDLEAMYQARKQRPASHFQRAISNLTNSEASPNLAPSNSTPLTISWLPSAYLPEDSAAPRHIGLQHHSVRLDKNPEALRGDR